jgi:hypothetical protein
MRIACGSDGLTNLKLAPDNLGVLLRRKLDYQFPNQRAEVSVAKLRDGKVAGAFKLTPVRMPLFPGAPLPELAWTELRYDAYCFVMPAAE